MEDTRDSWDEYFLRMAYMVATRSTCTRKQVGCVLVRDRAVLSTGYVGSAKGQPHCTDVGCEMSNGGCIRTIHGEANAVSLAAKNGTSINGATAYVTMSPCHSCFKMLINSGIKTIIYDEEYRIKLPDSLTGGCGVEFKRVSIGKTEDT